MTDPIRPVKTFNYYTQLEDIRKIVSDINDTAFMTFKRMIADNIKSNLISKVLKYKKEYSFGRELFIEEIKEIKKDFKPLIISIKYINELPGHYIYLIRYDIS